MTKYVYRIHSEWDIGHENIVFATKEATLDWIKTNPSLIEVCAAEGDHDDPLKLMAETGLVGYHKVELAG
jgi:hypothetical protein